MLISRTGKLPPDRTSKELCRDELTSSFGLQPDLCRGAASHLNFRSEIGVTAGMLAVICVFDGELSATARMNPIARQYATIAILGLPMVRPPEKMDHSAVRNLWQAVFGIGDLVR
jgi:hypothetical protein